MKLWLGGEGPNEIGDRDRPGGKRVGAIEALLLRVEGDGWSVAGATVWKRIRKLRVRAALGRDNHGDIHNIAGLVNEAFEQACEVVAFSRDVDTDRERASAITRGIAHAQEIFPAMGIIGGPAIPAIEGWILAILNVPHTESMSRDSANKELAKREVAEKTTEEYVKVISEANLEALPPGCDNLQRWIAAARTILPPVIHGTPA